MRQPRRRSFGTARPDFWWLIPIAIVVLGSLAYLTSFSGKFVFDDVPAIVENQSIRSLSFPEVLRPPAAATVSGRPFANLTFALNYMVGSEPFGFHLVNLSIHLAAALLLFGVTRRSLAEVPTGGISTAADALAAVIGLLWVTHPLHVSSVTYIVQRVESLMGLLFLATLYSAIRANGGGARVHRRWVLVSAVCCALGMATKEPMVMAPVLVWLWDVIFRKGSWLPWRNTERRATYATLAATWSVPLALLFVDSQARLVVLATLQSGIVEGVSPLTYFWTQIEVVLYYVRVTLVPVGLAFDYYGWPLAHEPGAVVGSLVQVLLLLGAVGVALWRRHPAGYAGAWCFLILAPTSSLVPIPTEVAAEHRMYLPSAGLISIIVVTLWRLTTSPARPRLRMLAVAGVAGSLATATLTFQRNRLFWAEETLWAAAVHERPGNARARINFGIALMKGGREAAAEEQMRAALALPADPKTRAQVLVQLGSSLAAQRQSVEGIRYLEQALALDPDLPEAHSILGQTYRERGEHLRALRHFERSLESRPDNVLTLNSFAWLVATAPGMPTEKLPAAVAAGERALRLTEGRDVDAYQALAAAYARSGAIQAALRTAEAGMQLAQRTGHPAVETLSRQHAYYESLRGKEPRVP